MSISIATPDLAIVDPARKLDQLQIRRSGEQETRIHRDAVSPNAHAGLVDMTVRLAVGCLDDLLDIDAYPPRIRRQLVCERDVDIPIGGIGKLAQLRRLGRLIFTISASRTDA